jgi:topoisomerase-4 subunit B
MTKKYDASSIEVLSGLEPVRKRPGMYTDTSRPNHLAHEVIDNAVDEALAGHAKRISVTLHKDGSLSCADDGRGMPVDVHPKEKVTGVELILTRLHAGGKFSDDTYQYAGGLHGVGVSVVNALSSKLEVEVRRDGKVHAMSYKGGDRAGPLKVVGKVGERNTGTTLRFWPDPKYFDSPKIHRGKLEHVLRAKAVLCAGLEVEFLDEASGERGRWQYEDGLADYLKDSIKGWEVLPNEPFVSSMSAERESAEWAVAWLPDGGDLVAESYVNLIPTEQGGTHVNGLRTGLTDALREFCDFRNLLPKGVKLAPEDVWDRCAYVLSVKMKEPQFSGQTKERLSSRDVATSSPASARIPSACGSTSIPSRARRSRSTRSPTPSCGSSRPRRWRARRSPPARRCPASSPIAPATTSLAPSCSWSRAIRPAARPSRPATASSRRSCRCAARS